MLDPLAPVVEEILHRLLKGDLRLPPGLCHKFAVVSQKHRHVTGPHSCGIFFRLHFHFGIRKEKFEHVSDFYRCPRTNIIDLSGVAFFYCDQISFNHIADVAIVAAGVKVPDANDRFLLRLREIAVSTEILRQVAENISDGAFCSRKQGQEIKVPAGEAYVRVESARGLLGCHVAADGGPMPARIQFRTPSHAHLAAIPELLSGTRLEDLPVVLSSLGLGVAEADR
ncbi:MAG TPA: hypothetical protein DCS07_14570 [Bdellovibrionales bacterium]|nr:hypothetical protein [Bdellovibrionales bacterium]